MKHSITTRTTSAKSHHTKNERAVKQIPYNSRRVSPGGGLAMALLAATLFTTTQSAWAQKLTTLYNFTGGNDGGSPYAGPILGANGVLYGTAAAGGSHCTGIGGCGVIFQLSRSGVETVLHDFAGGNSSDGAFPENPLIRDSNGNLYGTTGAGGKFYKGTAFELTSNDTERVLHNFSGGTDGLGPSQLVRDELGNLYGTTVTGGEHNFGSVFRLDPIGTKTLLYSFTGDKDGAYPYGGLVLDAHGNLYGSTSSGGPHRFGTVFVLTPAGKVTVLYTFTGGTDAGSPNGSLLRDAKGDLYGTSLSGGAFGYGTVFKVTSTGIETVLHSFSGKGDGYYPNGGLVRDAHGNFYGTTNGAGCTGESCSGSVFELSSSGVETVLYTFKGGSDGFYPSNLAIDTAGTLFGTTYGGGAFGAGTVFSLVP
jgi:uncharacterized repeat protein (TIGR03803 family)